MKCFLRLISTFHSFMKVICQLLAKAWELVLDDRLRGLILPRNSMIRFTDRPDMTLAANNNNNTHSLSLSRLSLSLSLSLVSLLVTLSRLSF